jgi:hypothetical protein
VIARDLVMTAAESVASAGFTIALATMTMAAGSGSAFVPSRVQCLLTGDQGPQLAVLRDAADGRYSVTRCLVT